MKNDAVAFGIGFSALLSLMSLSYWYTSDQNLLAGFNRKQWSSQRRGVRTSQVKPIAQHSADAYGGSVDIENLSNVLEQTSNSRQITGTLINNTNAPINEITLRYEISNENQRRESGTFCVIDCETYSLEDGKALSFSHRIKADGSPKIISVVWKYPDGSPGYKAFNSAPNARKSSHHAIAFELP